MNEAVRMATERLRAAGIESARREARVLWEHTHSVTGGVDGTFESAIARRLAHEPIAYITGEKEFWSLAFKVGPGALIPRPETETLIEGALREFSDREAPLSVLDLGTGSGCLLITFLMNYPKARGTGIDISEDALRWARANAAQHGVSTRSTFRRTDWAELGPAVYDVVLANPPYIPTEELEGLSPDVVRYEPHLALSGGMDGLDAYRALAQLLRTSLAPEGRAFLEIGQGQHHMVSQILESAGLQLARIVEDLAGIPRCMVAKAHPEARNTAK
ncbi:MAG TPA: peptide chain release factor N(5)-glutamine methyltransferase [Rhizomicrobium sp.]|nr:peptide chain release factor N(5)-glutamine methyltransferase [Rhizomicrobium sp.]